MKLPSPAAVFLSFGMLSLCAQQASVKPPVGVPEDAKPFHGKWYKVYVEKCGWKRAKERCAIMGGQLAVIPDAATQDFIKQLADGKALRLGATDLKVEGVWEWIDGQPMKFKAWGHKQPEGDPKQNYLCIGERGLWHDTVEEVEPRVVGFICEWKGK